MGDFMPDRVRAVAAARFTPDECPPGADDLRGVALRCACDESLSVDDLLEHSRRAEREGLGGIAWALREAVAVRIIDLPNEREDDE